MEGVCWNNLPSVILVEIFSYLSQKDKIQASSTCKHWRCLLFYPSFWKSIHFKVKTKDPDSMLRTQFLANCFAKKLRNATISFESMDPLCVQEVADVIQKLCNNDHLRSLTLLPTHCRFECPGRSNEQKQFFDRQLMKPVHLLVQHCRQLEVLSLGCSEEMIMYAEPMLELLKRHQACSLRQLGLASVKDDPDDYILFDLEPNLFHSFQKLQVLSLDYDHVSNALLESLRNVQLLRFIIHVHGVEDSHPGTTNSAWTSFNQHNNLCQLRLTLIHSYDAVDLLHTDILKPAMPLTHLKVFFCEQVNIYAIHCLSNWYTHCLQSLWWVDSLNSYGSQFLMEEHEEPDPLIMAAWRCTKLEEIVLIGYKYFHDDLVAIARLRGTSLKRLDIADQDIVFGVSADIETLQQEMSEALGMAWAPLADSQLHGVILNPIGGDSDEFILPIVLQDEHL